ncbi:hypothetical protein LPB41_15090 [Thalassospira sp. MA62]|nr:hypothetical protein [Thalassospira sp. MA62]
MNKYLSVRISRFDLYASEIRQVAWSAFLGLCLLVPSVTFAQSDSPLPGAQDDGTDQPAASSENLTVSEDGPITITVTRSACKAMVAYEPEDDVTYQPGVDVHGKAVAPADLNGGDPVTKSLPKEIEFPVTIDFFEYAGIPAPRGTSGEQSMGKVSFRNGRVFFNDQPIGGDGPSAELIEACRKAGFR